jgi:DnaJ-class molecular chaperone
MGGEICHNCAGSGELLDQPDPERESLWTVCGSCRGRGYALPHEREVDEERVREAMERAVEAVKGKSGENRKKVV